MARNQLQGHGKDISLLITIALKYIFTIPEVMAFTEQKRAKCERTEIKKGQS